jgi:hypothetical protein
MTTYNFPDCVSGDTFLGVDFAISTKAGPVNLAGAVITIATNKNKTLSTTNGELIITDGPNGLFQVKEQNITWPSATYKYVLSVLFSTGRKRTYLQGTWKIE